MEMGILNTIMAYIVDISVVGILLYFVLSGAKQGFITCLFGFISTIAAGFLSFSFATLTAELTSGLFGLEGIMAGALTDAFSNLNGFNVIPDPNMTLMEQLQNGDMSQAIANMIAQNFEGQIPEGYTLGMMAGETVAEFATILLAGVALFFVLRIVFTLLKGFFNFIMRIGFLDGLNKLLGAVVGFIEGILLVSVAVAVMSLFPNMMDFLSSSLILTAIYNSNPLLWLIGLLMTL